MDKIRTITVKEEQDVRTASNAASHIAQEMGFEPIACAELALAVSEMAQNIIRYTQEGEVIFLNDEHDHLLEVRVVDHGPGIPNLEKAMRKGYTTSKNSLGIGLDVAKRSVDEFHIETDPENGTRVSLKKFLPIAPQKIDYGIVSLADERYAINGDDYLIKEYDGNKVLLAVIDGIGEGYPAHAAALMVKEYLQTHYRMPLDQLLQKIHQVLMDSELERGTAAALARIEGDQLSYIGIGDTHTYLAGEEIKFLYNHEGTLGDLQLPSLQVEKYELSPDTYVILCTDGIKSNLWFDEDIDTPPQQVANMVFNEFHRDYGDVTVLIAKYMDSL